MTSPVFKSPIPLNYLDTDTAMTANSDVKVPTQKAVKAYADTKASALGGDDNYVTDAEKTKLSNLSGTNTGDEVVATGAEITTGTDNDKMVTSQALADAGINLSNGWNLANETFTYASATTVTVSGDKTTKYYKGMKVKLTQATGGTKYFVIAIDPTYGAPNTTLTLHPYVGSTTIANEAITAPHYSSADKPAGFPSKPKFSGYLSSAQDNIADNTTTLINIDAENYDIGANFDTTTHLFTAPITGYYDVKGGVGWKSGTVADQKNFFVGLYVDSTENATHWLMSSGTGALIMPIARTLYVAKGSTINIRCYHNVGGATPDLYNNNQYTFLTIEFIEP